MSFVLLLPVILSLLVLGAHSMRVGMPWLTVLPLAMIVLLAWPRRWVARLAQAMLILGGLEWLRAMAGYIASRMDSGVPWMRLAVILTGVALFTGLSSLVFQSGRLRRRYHLDSSTDPAKPVATIDS